MTGKFGRIEFGILLEGTDKSGPNVGDTQGPTSINIVNNEKRIITSPCYSNTVRMIELSALHGVRLRGIPLYLFWCVNHKKINDQENQI